MTIDRGYLFTKFTSTCWCKNVLHLPVFTTFNHDFVGNVGRRKGAFTTVWKVDGRTQG